MMIEIIALIVSISTAVYTIYDRHHLRQSQKRLEKRLDSPKVAVSMRRDEVQTSLLIVCVENVGTGTARNVEFQLGDPSLITVSEIPLGDIGFLKHGIDYFGSGQKYEFPINTIRGEKGWNELMQTPLEMTIDYKNLAGEEQPTEKVHLNFGKFDRLPLVKSPISSMASTFNEMVKATGTLVKSTQEIGKNVNQYTHIRAGDKVQTREEIGGWVDGDFSHSTTIPENAICTVLEVTQEDITLEWDDAPEEEGRIIYHESRTLSEPFTLVKINLPPKQ